jgi:hypothetical protein
MSTREDDDVDVGSRGMILHYDGVWEDYINTFEALCLVSLTLRFDEFHSEYLYVAR